MEYAYSYALYNYYRINPKGNLDPENIRPIRRFEGTEAEWGFIKVHIAME